jgi:hypothetical protein
MTGKKDVLWVVVISAALITAGLSLSCGDDDTAACCQAACERLKECEDFDDIEFDDFGGTVELCVETCEAELAGAGGDLIEAFKCIPDTDCRNIYGDCFCPAACAKIDDCSPEYFWWLNSNADCLDDCRNERPRYIICFYHFSSCQFLYEFCWWD